MGSMGNEDRQEVQTGRKGRERYPGGFSAIPWNWQKRRCRQVQVQVQVQGGRLCRGGRMWPGGGKASDACTTVPTLPRACTLRRTGYLVPGPRHNRTEGQKSSAPSWSLLAGSTIRDGGEGEVEGDS